MRAVVIDEVGVEPTVREVPDPTCPPGGVVLDVAATGVCRSDWHVLAGHDPVTLPHVPGHELVGTIREVGEGVTRWRVGDRVTTPFVCGCGRCALCAAGESQVCPDQRQPGFSDWGSYAEQVALHAADHNIVAVPETMRDETAAALGCRFATSYRAVAQHGGVRADQWVAVHGAGGAGLIMADAAVQYLAQGFYGDELSAEMGVEDIGKGGFALLFRLTRIADGKVLARTRTGMVCFDYARQKVCRLPEALKTVLEVV